MSYHGTELSDCGHYCSVLETGTCADGITSQEAAKLHLCASIMGLYFSVYSPNS